MKNLTFCLFFLAWISVCPAKTATLPADNNSPVTLEQYITIALANNAGLEAAYQEYLGASEQVKQAKTLPDPQLKYGYATEKTPTRSTFEVMQEFPWFGTIPARTDIASALSNAASKKYDAKRLEILNELKRWFYEYCFLHRSIEITNENIDLLRHFEQVARSRYAAMTSMHPDIIKAQITLATVEDNIKSLNAYRRPLAIRLNSILNRPVVAELGWPTKPERKSVTLDFEMLYSLVMQNNPDIKALGYNIDAARSGEKLAEKKFYPNIGLGVAIDDGMGRDGRSRIMPVVAINIPLWRDSYKAGERQAEAMVNQAAKEKEQMQNTLAVTTQQVLFEFEDSTRKIHLYGDVLIPKSKEHLVASENAYQSGTIDFLALLDALQGLLDYQLLYERSLADNSQKLAELEMLTGVELSKEFPENKISQNPERNTK
ncbi:MAG: TolC family protein [Sedimentisphaerales bacterium]